jgi:hypothetical protein
VKLPLPFEQYDVGDQTRTRVAIEQELNLYRKKGADIELVNDRLILRSPNGTRYKLTVSNAGVLAAVAL